MKKKLKLPEYEFGTYVENPGSAITENQIAMAQAQAKGKSNPFAIGTNLFGNLAMQFGMSKMNKGMSNGEGVTESGFNWGNLLQQGIGAAGALGNGINSFATGGKVGIPTPINAEGNEVIETPGGTVAELNGPSHAAGGIDMILPSGTEIFSQRLKGSDGKTMAERKKLRENKLNKIQKLVDNNSGDALLDNTFKRTKANNDKKESVDMRKMQFAKLMSDFQTFATGGTVGWPPLRDNLDLTPDMNFIPNLGLNNSGTYMPTDQFAMTEYTPPNLDITSTGSGVPPENGNAFMESLSNIFGGNNTGGVTFGDATGFAGDLISTFGPMRNTQRSRATDTPNINPYANFGKDALTTTDKSKSLAAGVRDNQLQDLELSRNSAIRRGRNGSRSINTSRALDLATDMGVNNARTGVYNQYAQMLQAILGQEAGLENQQDQMVMQGDAARDRNDRADKDAYFSSMAQDIATQGYGLQKIGKDLNQVKTRNVSAQVMEDLFPNFSMDIMSGNLKAKASTEVSANQSKYATISDQSIRNAALQNAARGIWKWQGNKLIDVASNKEIDLTTGNIKQ